MFSINFFGQANELVKKLKQIAVAHMYNFLDSNNFLYNSLNFFQILEFKKID